MAPRHHLHARPPAAPMESFVGRLLDPIDRLAEATYWGKYTGASAWKTGLLLLAVAALMVAVAILLGG